MTFVTAGLAIAGLAAVMIPIIIHLLFRQRRKPIEWAAMRFLMEAFRKHRRRLQLEQLLLLAVRCLIVALFGFALARPLLSDAGLLNTGASRIVYLVIDNSMTAAVTNETGESALQNHVDDAIAMIESLGASDSIGVITAARPVNTLLLPPSTDHAGVVKLLRRLEPTASTADIPGALTALRNAIETTDDPDSQVLAYLLSDFRAGSADLDAPLTAILNDLPENVQLFAAEPAQQAVSNVQITSVDPVRSVVLPGASDGSGQITVRLARHGGALEADVTRVRLDLGSDTALPPQTVNWQPGQSEASVDFLLNISVTDDRELRLAASIDHDRIEADDQRYAVLTMRNRIGVLLVDRRQFMPDRSIEQLSAGQWVRRALEPAGATSQMEFIEVEPAALSQPDLRGADVMVLARPDLLEARGWELTRQFVSQGGLALIMPPAESRVDPWFESLAQELALPWTVQLEVEDHDPPLRFADQQPRDVMLRMLSSEMSDLLLPAAVHRTLPIIDTAGVGRSLLVFDNGSPAVVAASPTFSANQDNESIAAASGLIVMLTFAPELNWTNIPTKPLMVPLFQELVRQGLSQIRANRQALVGMPTNANLAPAAASLVQGDQRLAVLENGQIEQPLEQPGLYTIQDRALQSIGTLAVNVDPAAGRTQTQSEAAVQAWLRGAGPWTAFETGRVAAALENSNRRSPIARNVLLLVIALIVLETILARLFSHSSSRGRSVTTGIAPSSVKVTRKTTSVAPIAASGGAS